MKKTVLTISVLFLATAFSYAASQSRDVKTGNALYKKGDYAASVEKYSQALKKSPESDIINFNLGTAYYKSGDYEKTLEPLQKALLSDDARLKENVYYNLGNSFYKFGISQEKNNINSAIASLEQSLGQYESALKIDVKDEDARYNYAIVKKELERLQQKKQEQGGQQKKEEGKKEGKQKQEQPAGSNKAQDEKSSQEQTSAQAGAEQMTKKEAQGLLNNYEQNEEPKGVPNFLKRKGGEQPVVKDW